MHKTYVNLRSALIISLRICCSNKKWMGISRNVILLHEFFWHFYKYNAIRHFISSTFTHLTCIVLQTRNCVNGNFQFSWISYNDVLKNFKNPKWCLSNQFDPVRSSRNDRLEEANIRFYQFCGRTQKVHTQNFIHNI